MPEEPEPPRVNVALPGGRQVPARLLRWRRTEDGSWWAEVVLPVPAATVGRVEGEDYAAVEREQPAHPLRPVPADDVPPRGGRLGGTSREGG